MSQWERKIKLSKKNSVFLVSEFQVSNRRKVFSMLRKITKISVGDFLWKLGTGTEGLEGQSDNCVFFGCGGCFSAYYYEYDGLNEGDLIYSHRKSLRF